MKTNYVLIILISSLIMIFESCSKMNDLHEIYLKQGERIYCGQPDSTLFCSGFERVKMNYWISDPKVKKMKVFWNSGLDSIEIENISLSTNEPGTVFINNINPGFHSFKIVTYNENWEYPSIPLEATAEVYSSNYLNRLFPRTIKYATYLSPDSVYVKFNSTTEKCIGTIISYTDTSNKSIKKFISNDTSTVILNNFKDKIFTSTLFLPDINSIDTLFSPLVGFDMIDTKLDKSLFRRWNPAGIPYKELNNAWSIEKMWDNDYYGTSYLQPGISDFTFDLGQLVKINRIKQHQRWHLEILFGQQQIRTFQIWGSDSPEVTDDISGWTLLGNFSATKPSNKPLGQVDQIDIDFAKEGESFIIDKDSPKVRFIRYRILETWDKGTANATIGELDFFSVASGDISPNL